MDFHIFFHADLDGFASAGIVYTALRYEGIQPEYIYTHKINYGEKFDNSDIDYKNDAVFMVDFCLQPSSKMENLIRKAECFTWIDHHKTSLDFVQENKHVFSDDNRVQVVGDLTILDQVDHLIDTSKAACELTWRYFFNWEPPMLVKLIGQFDTWNKTGEYSWEKEVLPLFLYLNSHRELSDPTYVSSCLWWENYFEPILYPNETHRSNLHERWVFNLIEQGRPLLDFQNSIYEQIAKDGAYPATFLGKYKALCINSPIQNSMVLESAYDVSKYDLIVVYSFKNLKWTFSLYTTHDHVPCGDIAKKCGQEGLYKSGGGHQKAAGFQTTIDFLNSYIEPLEV